MTTEQQNQYRNYSINNIALCFIRSEAMAINDEKRKQEMVSEFIRNVLTQKFDRIKQSVQSRINQAKDVNNNPVYNQGSSVPVMKYDDNYIYGLEEAQIFMLSEMERILTDSVGTTAI